jgi:hypothetical protein
MHLRSVCFFGHPSLILIGSLVGFPGPLNACAFEACDLPQTLFQYLQTAVLSTVKTTSGSDSAGFMLVQGGLNRPLKQFGVQDETAPARWTVASRSTVRAPSIPLLPHVDEVHILLV